MDELAPVALEPVQGFWYLADSNHRVAALLSVTQFGRARVVDALTGERLREQEYAELAVSSRLGNSVRYVNFADGAVFETADNAGIDGLQQRWRPSRWNGWLHRLESRWRWVLVSVLVVIGLGWWGVQYGVPAAARHIAERLPPDLLDRVAAEVLSNLDRHQFAPSTLAREQQQALQARFAEVTDRYPELRLRVLFRQGGDSIGANAFALPDGTIIFTDEMVALAQRDEELLAVLAHEIGHIAERHSLRAVVQNALLGFALLLMSGDSSASAELFLGAPMLLATLSYSRAHEREADQFSAAVLDELGIERQAFVDLMQRLGHAERCTQLLADAELEAENDSQRLALCEQLQAEQRSDERNRWGNYLSTHPDMRKRLEDFLATP